MFSDRVVKFKCLPFISFGVMGSISLRQSEIC
jgi:hypothetical protein